MLCQKNHLKKFSVDKIRRSQFFGLSSCTAGPLKMGSTDLPETSVYTIYAA